MKNNVKDMLLEDCVGIVMNLNDTFYYASADAEEIYYEDLAQLEEVLDRYGYNAIVAYVALKRGHDPMVKRSLNDEFYRAKKEIEELCHKKEVTECGFEYDYLEYLGPIVQYREENSNEK